MCTAVNAEAAQSALTAFEHGPWNQKFPTVAAAWRRAWEQVIPFFAFPPEVRRVIYTTNAIESVNARPRKILKTRGHFPSDEAASKLIWLAQIGRAHVELQSLMRISYAVFCLKKKNILKQKYTHANQHTINQTKAK